MSQGRKRDSESQDQAFAVGPDLFGDIRAHRPYFLVPLLESPDGEELLDSVIARIERWLEVSTAPQPEGAGKGPVTDLYVLSHGWHRNLFKAIAAYDRLSSRLAQLLHRGRLTPPPDATYHPIFLNLHWHSDIGANGFVDPCGRRKKEEFLMRGRRMFRSIGKDPHFRPLGESATMTNDFEDLYQLFTTLSAPDIDALSASFSTRSATMEALLDHYELRDAPNATLYDKATAAWTCYHESEPERALTEQREEPGVSMSFAQSLSGGARFAASVLGWGAILCLAWKLAGHLDLHGRIARQFAGLQGPEPPAWAAACAGYGLLWAVLWIACWRASRTAAAQEGPRPRSPSLSLLGTVAWAVLTVLHSLPYVAYCLATYPLHGLIPVPPFDERFGVRGDPPERYEKWRWRHPHLRLFLSRFACIPCEVAKRAMRYESKVFGLLDAVESQLRFAEMQSRAVKTSESACATVLKLLERCVALRSARIHLVGHSFGGLLVANLAKQLAHSSEFQAWARNSGCLATVSTLQGALMSSWYDRELVLLRTVRRCIATVYSRYDTANGFYYPLAMHGRKAAGFVGSWLGRTSAEAMPVLKPLPCATLTATPDLAHRIELNRQTPVAPALLNLDASRIVFQGSPASGGGHGDIFSDDIVHLLWAVQHYEPSAVSSD